MDALERPFPESPFQLKPASTPRPRRAFPLPPQTAAREGAGGGRARALSSVPTALSADAAAVSRRHPPVRRDQISDNLIGIHGQPLSVRPQAPSRRRQSLRGNNRRRSFVVTRGQIGRRPIQMLKILKIFAKDES